MLLLNFEQPSLLKQRFSKNIEKKESALVVLIKHLQEFAKPISEKNMQSEEYISRTKKLLLQAGLASSKEDVEKYDIKKLTNLMLALIVCFLLILIDFSIEMFLTSILISYIAFKYEDFKLQNIIKERKKEMMRFLPDAIDLLSICIQAGLGLDASFSKIAEEFSLTSKVISNEFARLNRDILSGLSHQEAFKNLSLRNDSPDLQSFVALLIQSDKLGTSITQSLEAFCDSMRTKKRQRIEELTQQASTKMTVPMVLFMLPAIFLIIMYPAIQKIMANFH